MDMNIKNLIIYIISIIFIFSVELVSADEIKLKDGKIFFGNIVNINEDNKTLTLDLVMDNKLIGIHMTLGELDIDTIIISDDYRLLKREEISLEDKEHNLAVYKKRIEQSYKIDDMIWQRIEQRKNRKFKERNINNSRQHVKEMEILRHENRKSLITHTKNELVTPIVKIEDRPADYIVSDFEQDYER